MLLDFIIERILDRARSAQARNRFDGRWANGQCRRHERLNILFIASMPIENVDDRGIFPDLVRALAEKGHRVIAVSAAERREKRPTTVKQEGSVTILQVKTLNNRRVFFLEKALSVVLTPYLFGRAITKHVGKEPIDLIVYSTPPVTLFRTIRYLKKRFSASTYLMLKDIWPQVMADLQVIKKGSLFWKVFESQARKLYQISDFIGTMSPGNSAFILAHYPFIPREKVEVCPNAAEPMTVPPLAEAERRQFREKHGIPAGAVLLAYGGSFNRPQGIPFLLEVLASYRHDERFFFFLCGAGTDYGAVERWLSSDGARPPNVKLLPYLPKADYFELLRQSDAGLVFLDARFTVPNMPSRTLDYMQHALPVAAAVDRHTDFRAIMEQGGFGLASFAGDLQGFRANMERLLDAGLRRGMGDAGRRYLEQHWSAANACDAILRHFQQD